MKLKTNPFLALASSIRSFTIFGTSLIRTAAPEPTGAPAGLLLDSGLQRRWHNA